MAGSGNRKPAGPFVMWQAGSVLVSVRQPYHPAMVTLKRIYEPFASEDGFRILVDRIWPRGVSRDAARLDLWLKEVAPTPELRKWFGHDPERFAEFSDRYTEELSGNQALDELRSLLGKHGQVTLLYAAKDTKHNHVAVLLQVLQRG